MIAPERPRIRRDAIHISAEGDMLYAHNIYQIFHMIGHVGDRGDAFLGSWIWRNDALIEVEFLLSRTVLPKPHTFFGIVGDSQ